MQQHGEQRTALGEGTALQTGGKWQGYAAIVAAAFLLSWQSPCAKLLMANGVQSFDTVTMLFVVAVVLAHLIALVRGRLPEVYRKGRRHWKVVLPIGITNFGISAGMFLAARTLSAGVISVVLYLAPALICIFFMITKIRPIGTVHKVAVVVSFVGCVLALNVIGAPLGEFSVVGLLFALIGGGSYAAYIALCDLTVPPDLDKLSLVTTGLLVSTVLSVVANPTMFLRFADLALMDWGLFFYLALMTKFVALFMIVKGTQAIGSEKSSVVLSMEVPFTLLVAFVVLGETMRPIQLVGTAFVVGAAILLQQQGEKGEA